jgi:hypothetical protein
MQIEFIIEYYKQTQTYVPKQTLGLGFGFGYLPKTKPKYPQIFIPITQIKPKYTKKIWVFLYFLNILKFFRGMTKKLKKFTENSSLKLKK